MKGSSENASILRDKRPPQISVSKVFSANHKWKECKIIGKNISIRSYSAACAFRNRFVLPYADFISMEAIRYSLGHFMTSTVFPWMRLNLPSIGEKYFPKEKPLVVDPNTP